MRKIMLNRRKSFAFAEAEIYIKVLKFQVFQVLLVFIFFNLSTVVRAGENTIRIGLESVYLNAQSVALANNTILVGTGTGETFYPVAHFTAQTGFRVIAAPHFNGVILADGYENLLESAEPLLFVDGGGGFMSLGGRTYRGIIELGVRGFGITPVNIVNLEEYLFSVVPSEMPASWHLEALKAQAVAARSFTVARRGSHAHLGYDLCDTIFSQVYTGMEREHFNSTLAVELTRGQKAFYDGRVILATYFSSSGGFTESSENVWLEAAPYLRGIPDPWETGYMVWERSFTLSEIENIMAANNVNIGSLRSVAITERTPMGRVATLTFRGTTGDYSIRQEMIRTFFEPSYEGSLPGRNFSMIDGITTTASADLVAAGAVSYAQNPLYVIYVTDTGFNVTYITDLVILSAAGLVTGTPAVEISESTGYRVVFSGRGWGHGVGMSQFGANSMANAGFTYIEILQHYYTGITIYIPHRE